MCHRINLWYSYVINIICSSHFSPSPWRGNDRTGKVLEKDDNDSGRQRRAFMPVTAGRLAFSALKKLSGIERLWLFSDSSSKRMKLHQGDNLKRTKTTGCSRCAELRGKSPFPWILQILKVLHEFKGRGDGFREASPHCDWWILLFLPRYLVLAGSMQN